MKKPVHMLFPIMMALVVTACTDGGKEAGSPRSACGEALGTAGVAWFERKAGKLEVDADNSSTDLKEARSEYYKQMNPYDPDAQNWAAEICDVRRYVSGRERVFTLVYGPSSVPFNSDSGEEDGTMTSLNSDVKLHQRQDVHGKVEYGVYVRCKVSGTPPQQLDETPLAGVMTDTLTGDTSAREHMKHLLHSTQVMARALACQNKPAIPSEPPSSVG
ncbi:hypothetical protein [Streptomyces sp. NPDC056983]|uniref:hypothetical protein n=1 Tax=Streptomyces sp. NPDC056983 TaxID=3345987 RepID=UPI003637E793